MQATLSHYRILEQIGAGGMGVVYRAHDERLDRDVALKVLPSGMLTDSGSRKRFRKEALALSKLNHPNIAIVHDFDSEDGVDFLVEEFIDGLSLDAMLSAGPLSEKEIVNLGAQLADGIAATAETPVLGRREHLRGGATHAIYYDAGVDRYPERDAPDNRRHVAREVWRGGRAADAGGQRP